MVNQSHLLLHLCVLFAPSLSIRWHAGCMCELKETEEASTGRAKLEEAKVEAEGLHPRPKLAQDHLTTEAGFGSKFFRVGGEITEFCPCSIYTISRLNAEYIAPVMEKLLRTYFFRYFRVSLDATCPFWHAEAYCTIKDCSVEEASSSEEKSLGALDMSRCPKVHEHWREELRADSWTNEGENEEAGGMHYIDLIGNPERYTGYKREAGAAQVWHQIHAFNTFHSAGVAAAGGDEETADSLKEMPMAHRVFCKAVSGLHTSISSHIACGYLLDKPSNVWGVDVDQYIRRVASHPDRVNNLYFTFLLVLRAVDAAAEFLEGYDFATQVPQGAQGAGPMLSELLSTRGSWPVSFEQEHAFVVGDDGETDTSMLSEFKEKFYNISRIMDCVGCQRCRLWGKLQVTGLGAALRILYAPDRAATLKALHRNHIVALINVLGRLSHSVKAAQDLLPMTKLIEDTNLRQETMSQNAVNGGVAVMEGTPADDPNAQATTEFRKKDKNGKGGGGQEGIGGGGRSGPFMADFKFSHGGKFGI